MPVAELFRVNYYVGALLAQGGNLKIEDTKILFSPTSAIDRAMGAHDVEIPFSEIESLTYGGTLSRFFTIKAADKIHKFEGGQTKRVWEILEKQLAGRKLSMSVAPVSPAVTTAATRPAPSLVCDNCKKSLQSGYTFCPHCGVRPKVTCSACRKTVELGWSSCAFCGWKLSTSVTKAA